MKHEPTIIYEDDTLVVVNKPHGLMVHDDGKAKNPTLADWILEKFPEMKDVGEPTVLKDGREIIRPGIVHRLDKDTSGVLLLAKTKESHAFLKKQFQEHAIKKTYIAFVYGVLISREGEIALPMGRSARDFRCYSTNIKDIRGTSRDAYTRYKVRAKNNACSCVEVYPKTGRTHQIRVHLKAIGHPVICDTLYMPKRECPPNLGRLALHARSLEFVTIRGISLRLEAPTPEDMKHFAREQFPKLRLE